MTDAGFVYSDQEVLVPLHARRVSALRGEITIYTAQQFQRWVDMVHVPQGESWDCSQRAGMTVRIRGGLWQIDS